MDATSPDDIESLVAEIHTSTKYRAVCPDVIRGIGVHELTIRRTFKMAVKETRNTLHQVAGAYLRGRMRYGEWLEKMPRPGADTDDVKRWCEEIMGYHVSTRERLRSLPQFYEALFASIQTPDSILDIGCGLNPLSLPWMPLENDVEYFAYDLFTDQADFLNRFFPLVTSRGKATALDIAGPIPDQYVDLALVFKVLPLLEHLPHGEPLSLLRRINAGAIAVSFPTHSIGGKAIGMPDHYDRWFQSLLETEGWQGRRLPIRDEMVYLVEKER